MAIKRFKIDKELKKAQKKGIYNPKVKFVAIMAVVLLTVLLGTTYAIFSSTSNAFSLFSADSMVAGKKIIVNVTAVNGSVEGENSKSVVSSTAVSFNVTPDTGYQFDSVDCTYSDIASYDASKGILNVTTDNDTSCTIRFKVKDMNLRNNIIANNTLKTATPDFTKGEPLKPIYDIETTGSGLYKAEDYFGDSYYFRGAIDNNYVSFGTYNQELNSYTIADEVTYYSQETAIKDCNEYYNSDYNYESAEACIDDIKVSNVAKTGDPIIWRIIRINGDGTIRIATDDFIGESAFNESFDDQKYVGYTYNSIMACTNENACDGSEGDPSTIKTYLENWYNTNLKTLDNKIARAAYCNDTTYVEKSTGKYTYNAKERIYNGNPSLKCPDTDQYYGGKYNLKIGLLSADELTLAGFANNYRPDFSNYLYGGENIIQTLTMSPFSWTASKASVITAESGILQSNPNYGKVDIYYNSIRPVINLKADTLIVSGNGTKDSPYVIN